MKKLIMFFSGLILLCIMFGMIVVGAAIYDTASQQTIDTFFFQPANLSSGRIGVPAAVTDLSDEKIRKMLVEKFVTEYFYVIPDMVNVTMRLKGEIGLRKMVSENVFQQWLTTTGAEISTMATEKSMRMARLIDMRLPMDSEDWWEITYELITWSVPNDFTHAPVVTRGKMNINMRYQPGFWRDSSGQEMDIGTPLEQGADPASLFKFRVFDVLLME